MSQSKIFYPLCIILDANMRSNSPLPNSQPPTVPTFTYSRAVLIFVEVLKWIRNTPIGGLPCISVESINAILVYHHYLKSKTRNLFLG